jgi:hypothetical protein
MFCLAAFAAPAVWDIISFNCVTNLCVLQANNYRPIKHFNTLRSALISRKWEWKSSLLRLRVSYSVSLYRVFTKYWRDVAECMYTGALCNIQLCFDRANLQILMYGHTANGRYFFVISARLSVQKNLFRTRRIFLKCVFPFFRPKIFFSKQQNKYALYMNK